MSRHLSPEPPRRPLAAAYTRLVATYRWLNDERWWPHLTGALVGAVAFCSLTGWGVAAMNAAADDVDTTAADAPPTHTTGRTAVASIEILPPVVPSVGAVDEGKAPGDVTEEVDGVAAPTTPNRDLGTRPAQTGTPAATSSPAPATTVTVTATPLDCLDPMVECACDHLAHDPDRDCDPTTSSIPTAPATTPTETTTATPTPTSSGPAPEPAPTETLPFVDDLLEVIAP
ncbi:hypothetical protein [Blastococcus sp. SYSU D00813]